MDRMTDNIQKILITGGSGFIGTNVVDYLQTKEHELLSIDIKPPKKKEHDALWKKIDINDFHALQKCLRDFQPDYIIHLAARTDLNGKSLDDYRANVEGVQNLVDAAKNTKSIKRVIFTSSKFVCENGYLPKDDDDFCPNTVYGESKVEGEKIVRRSIKQEFSWVIVRPTSIWGPWFGEPYRNFFDVVKKGLYLHPKNSVIWKTYGFSGNTVYQIERILMADAKVVDQKVFYLGDYPHFNIIHWANLISKAFGVGKPLEVPLAFLKLFACLGDMMKSLGIVNFPYSSFRLRNILADTSANLKNLEELCGNLPFSLEEGVKITVDWLKQNG